MRARMAVLLPLVLAATSAFAMPRAGSQFRTGQFSRGHSSQRGIYAGGHAGRGFGGGGYAVPRGYAGRYSPGVPGAQYRHPRAGYGTGYARGYGYGHGLGYGRGYGYGHGYYPYGYARYGHGHYGRHYGSYPRYGSYPYYRSYPYYGYNPYYGVGLGFYYGGGYPAPSYAYPSAVPYAGAVGDEPYDGSSDRGEQLEGEAAQTAELRLLVTPGDASVWVDDEFRGAARGLTRLALSPGQHRIEVVRPGFRAVARDIEVRAGVDNSVRIDLESS